jgi:hypothetical protein
MKINLFSNFNQNLFEKAKNSKFGMMKFKGSYELNLICLIKNIKNKQTKIIIFLSDRSKTFWIMKIFSR